MRNIFTWKTLGVLLAAALLFGTGALLGYANKPNSVIHVVTLDWNEGADVDAALKGVEELADSYDGITRIWLRSIKAQGAQAAFVMEFKDQKALEDYAGSDAQKKWYEVYMPARKMSRTFDITN